MLVLSLITFALLRLVAGQGACPTHFDAGPENGATVRYFTSNTCIMNRLFSIVPPGLYTLTATVDGAPHAFSTSVPGTNPPQASDFFIATFSDVTVGTVNQVVTFSITYVSTTVVGGTVSSLSSCSYSETISYGQLTSATTVTTQSDTVTGSGPESTVISETTSVVTATTTATVTVTPPPVTDTKTYDCATVTTCEAPKNSDALYRRQATQCTADSGGDRPAFSFVTTTTTINTAPPVTETTLEFSTTTVTQTTTVTGCAPTIFIHAATVITVCPTTSTTSKFPPSTPPHMNSTIVVNSTIPLVTKSATKPPGTGKPPASLVPPAFSDAERGVVVGNTVFLFILAIVGIIMGM